MATASYPSARTTASKSLTDVLNLNIMGAADVKNPGTVAPIPKGDYWHGYNVLALSLFY